jgi:hypothetical protein
VSDYHDTHPNHARKWRETITQFLACCEASSMLRGDHEKEERKKSFRLAASADLMRAIRASETALCDRYPAAEKVSTSRCVRYFWLTIGIGLSYNARMIRRSSTHPRSNVVLCGRYESAEPYPHQSKFRLSEGPGVELPETETTPMSLLQ